MENPSVTIRTFSMAPVDPIKHDYPGIEPGTKILASGTVHHEGHRPLLSDILLEQDITIPMRDGINLYADIYRPRNAPLHSIPAIIAAGPFGRVGGPNRMHFNEWPWRFGCPKKATTGLEKFEGPDPGYWCYHGYAVVHTECRGTWKSDGIAQMPCKKEGEDNYDIIEFLAAQPWCNGKISMCGNSYLTMTQWFAGAENPPHLACLAPWEGVTDLYRDMVRRGGIPNPGMADGLLRGDTATLCNTRGEDLAAMTFEYPLWNEYWENHRPRFQDVRCPLYVVSSWTNALHVSGSFRGWEKAASEEKWLRVHASHEWPDLYEGANVEDLRKFYDFYMKGISNDWIHTPKVRLSVLNPGYESIVNRPESSFPLARQQPLELYLDAKSMTLSPIPPSEPSFCSYDALTGNAKFKFILDKPLEFIGHIRVRLWVEAEGNDDMDVFAFLQKFDPDTGKLLESVLVDVGRLQDDPEKERKKLVERRAVGGFFTDLYFDNGPFGCLRASHRSLDMKESTDFLPVHSHLKEDLLKPGEIVPLDIAIWPYGMICNRGEELRLTISGVNYKQHLRPNDVRPRLRNKGMHKLHTGGEKQSYVLLPMVPPQV